MMTEVSWSPSSIAEHVETMNTSTKVCIVQTDVGQGYLKTMTVDESPHLLACEYVGTKLANWLGLRTFEHSVIELNDRDISLFPENPRRNPGPAFITRAVQGIPWSGSKKDLRKYLKNSNDLGVLVVFDMWTCNCDRYRPANCDGRNHDKDRAKYDNVFFMSEGDGDFTLVAMDHTHCFTCGRELNSREFNISNLQSTCTFGRFPEFQRLICRDIIRATAQKLLDFDRNVVREIIEGIPQPWIASINTQLIQDWEDWILRRSQFLSERIESLLFPQQELPFIGDSQGLLS